MFFFNSKNDKTQPQQINNNLKNSYLKVINSDIVLIINDLVNTYDFICESIFNENKNMIFFRIFKNFLNELENKINFKEIYFKKVVNSGKYSNNSNSLNYFYHQIELFYSKYRESFKQEFHNTNLNDNLDFFQTILNSNIEIIISNNSLLLNFLDNIKEVEAEKIKNYSLLFLMSICFIFLHIFVLLLKFNDILDDENSENFNDLNIILNNISDENLESLEVLNNIENISKNLFKEFNFTKFDYFIYILSLRKNQLIFNYNIIVGKKIKPNIEIFIDKLLSYKKENFIYQLEEEAKKFIENYDEKYFVKLDKFQFKFLDYYLISIFLNDNLISLTQSLEFTFKGILSNNFDKNYSYKKAILDFNRYKNKDFFIELENKNLINLYESIENGYDFEKFCEILYQYLDYYVTSTPLSNDQGADLIIEKNNIKKVVQAKFYTSPVGNKAIQQVVASKAYYKADFAIVITNNQFTKSAIQLAKANNVELVNGDDIINLIQTTNKKE